MRRFNKIASSATTTGRPSLISPAIRKARRLRRKIKLELATGKEATEYGGSLDTDDDDKACDRLTDAEIAECSDETSSSSTADAVNILIVTI